MTDLHVGQRLAWLSGGQGSFADAVIVAADKAVPIPDEIDDETATARRRRRPRWPEQPAPTR